MKKVIQFNKFYTRTQMKLHANVISINVYISDSIIIISFSYEVEKVVYHH